MKSKTFNRLKNIRRLSRELRKEATECEMLLWQRLRNRKLSGYKFLRQHPVIYKSDYTGMQFFIADFYCDAEKTVIELDGPMHEENKEYDHFRDAIMKEKGLSVLRITNEELANLEKVLLKIVTFLNSHST